MDMESHASNAPLNSETSKSSPTSSSFVYENFFSDQAKNHKDKIIAPELTMEIISDGEKLRAYFKEVVEMVTFEISVPDVKSGRNVKFRVLRWDQYTVPFEKYIIFVPTKIHENKYSCLLLRFSNLYLLGVQNSNSHCTIFHQNLEFGGWGAQEYKKFLDCLGHYGLTKEIVHIGEAYSCLQDLSGFTRSDLTLGRNKLIETLTFLSNSDWSDQTQVSLYLMYTTQFFCEPLRIKEYADWLCDKILANNGNGLGIPLIFLILQYGWADTSESILRLHYGKKEMDVFLEDNQAPLSVEILSAYYAILINYREKFDFERDSVFRYNMKSMYLLSFPGYSSFGRFYKSSVSVELATDAENYRVKAIKHVFEKNVVFEYNYLRHENPEMLEKNVRVSVDYHPEDIEEYSLQVLENTSVQCPLQNQILVAVDKPHLGVTGARFLNTLSFDKLQVDSTENNTAQAKVEIKLKNLYFFGTDHIQKYPKDFKKEWEGIGQNCEREDVYVFKPRSNGFLSSPVEIVNNIFGMHLCEEEKVVPEVPPKYATLTICSLSGVYMKHVTVLVQVTINFIVTDFINTEAMQMKVTHRCDDRSVDKYIRKTVVNWLQLHSKVCNRQEYVFYGSSEDSGEGLPLELKYSSTSTKHSDASV